MTPASYRVDYDKAWPKIARTLERLCDEYGWDTVLGVFSNDMPDHRREREREEREQGAGRQRSRKARKRHKHSAEVISLDAYRAQRA